MIVETKVQKETIARSININFLACLALVVQFLLGMVVNLFVTIPDHHPGSHAKNFFAGVASGITWAVSQESFWLILHILFGFVLIIASFVNIVLASQIGRKIYTVLATLGAFAILGAAFNGISFINYGENFSSMIMAGLFALALFCYLTCGYLGAIAKNCDQTQ